MNKMSENKILKIEVITVLTILIIGCVDGLPTNLGPLKRTIFQREGDIPFRDCGSIYDVRRLNISNCTKLPCYMPHGANIEMTTVFYDFGEPVSALNHKASWIINNIKKKASITPDVCDDGTCPIKMNEGFQFSVNIQVDKQLPPFKGQLRLEIANRNGKTVLCYSVDIKITK